MAQATTHSTGRNADPLGRPPRVLLFTDTLADINGVSRFIRSVGQRATELDHELRIFTSTEKRMPDLKCATNFDPVHAITMPKYPELDLVAPPVFAMLRAAEQFQPDVIHISTPGTVGFVGLLAAARLRCPMLGVYHTDFPAYIEGLFKSATMGRQTARMMGLFYKRFHTVFARSEAYRESVARIGVPQGRITTFPPGIDVDSFHPSHRDESIWKEIADAGGPEIPSSAIKVLYVGRISVEKNTPMLERIWPDIRKRCEARGVQTRLVIVGDGPDRHRLGEALKRENVSFLGFRHGVQLSRIYASSDLFVFPSRTDTLGQVVMEAQSSGLPAVVGDEGGPATIVRDGETGRVLGATATDDWIEAVTELVCDARKRTDFGCAAHEHMRDRGFASSFLGFWEAHEQAWRDHLETIDIRDAAHRPHPLHGS